MSTVFDDLLTVARQDRKFTPLGKEEPVNDYLKRLTEVVSQRSKEEFEGMSGEAQDWFDSAASALNAEQDLPVPTGFDRAAATAPVKPNGTDKQGASASGRGRRRTGNGDSQAISTHVRRLVIADESASVDTLIEKLRTANIADMTERRSTVATIRYDTLATLKEARSMGWQSPTTN